ncbi:hypothetical protein [Protofrankia coriariae]|uniref:Uncharacterized protein n=1 Tax=Protofrankia coriariae TaxID=1562887 RepID=A0ABR5EZR7_9ACTN|nr:hypothetical protein [Protofrankia coriariae]KLL09954.1 hypothetical protein FrCorBMG51_21205 [Protofrankia coriariae]
MIDGPAAGGTAHGQAADDPARRRTATAQVAAADAASDPEYAHAGPDDVEFAAEAAGNADADGSADAAEADGAQDPGQTPGSAGAARPAARTAGRPNTSRPGRVQVNPPGTHGGLTAGPTATSVPGSQQPASGSDDPGEADELLRRHAVGS